jgi:hypothetical protein
LAAAAFVAAIAAAPASADPARFADPLQPWSSPDGKVHLLRPPAAAVSTLNDAVGSLMSPGWRLVWNGDPTPGRLVARFSLRVTADAPQTNRTEYLQIGVGRGRKAARGCLSDGLESGSGARQADRVINGRRYAVWTNGDAGMSQQIAATDLRTVVGGACYAVERFSYGDSASDPDPAVTLPQKRGAAMLDRSLASLRLGARKRGEALSPPTSTLPPSAVAR